MQHQCKVTVIETKCFEDLQKAYLADPKSGPCPCFKVGDEFLFQRTSEHDDYYHLGEGVRVHDGGNWPCGEAWDAVNRYIYTALQGGSIMHKWCRDERLMIGCCNDGTRPVVFKIARIDIPETAEESEWLSKQDFVSSPADAYIG